jgi:hypothetical protein
MADNLLFLARGLRSRAAEILLKIEIMTDADALAQMREIAARYVRLAQRLEEASDGADSA